MDGEEPGIKSQEPTKKSHHDLFWFFILYSWLFPPMNFPQNHFETTIKVIIFASELKKRGRLSPLLFYQSIPIAIGNLYDNEY
jgi:hypothetical protein